MSAATPRPTDETVGGSSAVRTGAHPPALVLLGWLAARVLIGVVYLSLQFSTRPLAWGDLALYEFWADTPAVLRIHGKAETFDLLPA